MNAVIIGIDPGISGGVAFLRPTDRKLHVYDMPTLQHSNGKRRVHSETLADLIARYHQIAVLAVVEEVHSMPQQGVASTFAFGAAYGVVLGVLGAFHVPLLSVSPAVWKGTLGLSSDKNHSRTKASFLFPMRADKFKRVKDDGRAEAALLAFYGEQFVGRR
jgi:crossover junction endodeoxyribonuclease RuvC